MGGVGMQELLFIAFIALLLFGPDRLPEFARQAGKLLARFRAETSKSIAELKRAADVEDLDRELKAVRREIRSIGRDLTDLGASDGVAGDGAGRRPAAVPEPRSEPPPLDPEAT
jgi:sec-independent protein translocase protein TatB